MKPFYTLLVFQVFWISGYSQQTPPCTDSLYRQFDFWIGDWDVYSKDSTYQGSNHVQQLLNTCVLQENWTGASASIGTSFNTYDYTIQQWRQVWVDNGGNTIHFNGNFHDGAMRLAGQRIGPAGKPVYDSLVFKPNLKTGEVHQIWTISQDQKQWEEIFYGIYIPKGQTFGKVNWSSQIAESFQGEPHRQFDFWIGDWKGKVKAKSPEGEWEEQGRLNTKIFPILNGKAILEVSQGQQKEHPLQGFSVRFFNTQTEQWESWLYWPGGNRIIYPLYGNFTHGRGEFFIDFTPPGGLPQTSRYTFSDITDQSFRWDAAVSTDERKTWSTNLIFENHKLQNTAKWLSTSDPWFENWSEPMDQLSVQDHRLLEWEGQWSGTLEVDGQTQPVEWTVHSVMNGQGLLDFMTIGTVEHFGVTAFVSTQDWRRVTLSDQPDEGIHYLVAPNADGPIHFVEQLADEQTAHHRFELQKDNTLNYIISRKRGEEITSKQIIKLKKKEE
ncbi:MAG: hypothetical protein AAF598_06425 [Bacteroidota bacterium]